MKYLYIQEKKRDNYAEVFDLFPQEIVVQLGESAMIKTLDVISTGIRKIQLDKCDGPQANTWEIVSASEASDGDGDLQRLSLQIPPRVTASYLRIKVLFFLKFCLYIVRNMNLRHYYLIFHII
jgi:hypothetical protein